MRCRLGSPQVIGAIAGAALLFGIFSSSPIYRIEFKAWKT